MNVLHKLLIQSLVLLPALLLTPIANSDTVAIPVGQQSDGQQSIARPTSGMSGYDVIKKFGEPLATDAPVGEPPISRWTFADFYVFFEYDRVIHSVLKHNPR